MLDPPSPLAPPDPDPEPDSDPDSDPDPEPDPLPLPLPFSLPPPAVLVGRTAEELFDGTAEVVLYLIALLLWGGMGLV